MHLVIVPNWRSSFRYVGINILRYTWPTFAFNDETLFYVGFNKVHRALLGIGNWRIWFNWNCDVKLWYCVMLKKARLHIKSALIWSCCGVSRTVRDCLNQWSILRLSRAASSVARTEGKERVKELSVSCWHNCCVIDKQVFLAKYCLVAFMKSETSGHRMFTEIQTCRWMKKKVQIESC